MIWLSVYSTYASILARGVSWSEAHADADTRMILNGTFVEYYEFLEMFHIKPIFIFESSAHPEGERGLYNQQVELHNWR